MMKQVLRGTALFSLITPAAMALELTNPHFEEARRSWQESPLRTADPVLNYSFNSKIAAGSSVGYTGQIFRQLLMVDLKTAMTSTDRDGAGIRGQYPGVEEEVVAVFDSYYSYRYDREITSTGMINGFVPFHFLPKDVNGWLAPVLEGTIYDEIQEEGKQLRNKTAGNDNALRRGSLKGWNTMEFHGQNLRTQESDSAGDGFVEPEDLIDAFFRIAADNAVHGLPFTVANGDRAPQMVDKAYVTEDGLDVAQLTQKLLYGAVSFSQAAIDYLGTGREGKGILASDSEPYKPGKPYTALEHHWDEAYGYYGAARDLPSYTREQLSAGVSIDSNGDQLISIQSEVNFVMPRNGAKLDRAAAEPDSRLSYAAWEYLTTGRRLIAEARPGYRDNLADVATLALVLSVRYVFFI